MIEQFFHKYSSRYENSGLDMEPIGAWQPIVDRANSMGATIEFQGDTVSISYGRSYGQFVVQGGGAQYALDFLEGVQR